MILVKILQYLTFQYISRKTAFRRPKFPREHHSFSGIFEKEHIQIFQKDYFDGQNVSEKGRKRYHFTS